MKCLDVIAKPFITDELKEMKYIQRERYVTLLLLVCR